MSDPDFYAAMQARRIVPRDFIRLYPRTFASTPVVTPVGFWSGLQLVTLPVVNPDTGLSVDYVWNGAGSLISISAIPAASSLTVQNVTVKMSHLLPAVEDAVRGYNLKQAKVEIYSGLFDPDTHLLVSPAECVFVGYADECTIVRPAANEEGSLTLSVTSDTQEMTRANPAKRSNESQLLRSAGDNFYQDTATIKNRKIFWGSVPTNSAAAPRRVGFTG